jgi:hypothetical protein
VTPGADQFCLKGYDLDNFCKYHSPCKNSDDTEFAQIWNKHNKNILPLHIILPPANKTTFKGELRHEIKHLLSFFNEHPPFLFGTN